MKMSYFGQVLSVEPKDGQRAWKYGTPSDIPPNAVSCGPDCYLVIFL